MTHSGGKPHNVGDRGQRFEIRATGYPDPGVNVIGWCDKPESAVRMAAAIRLAPGCTDAEIVDREAP